MDKVKLIKKISRKHGRRPTVAFKDKSKYSRKVKHKRGYE